MKEAIERLLLELRRQGHEMPAPADTDCLKQAEGAGFPSELLDFYARCEPRSCIELKQRIWSIDSALIENSGAMPGCALSPHGLIVFASTLCGDAYCLDTKSPNPDGYHPVFIFSHEIIDEDATLELIQSARVEVAGSLQEFLVHFTDGTLCDEPWLS